MNADTRKVRKHRRTAVDSNPHHDLDKGQTSGLLIGCPRVLPWSTRRAPRTHQYKVKRQTGRTYHKVPVPVTHFPNITVRGLCHFLDGDNEIYNIQTRWTCYGFISTTETIKGDKSDKQVRLMDVRNDDWWRRILSNRDLELIGRQLTFHTITGVVVSTRLNR